MQMFLLGAWSEWRLQSSILQVLVGALESCGDIVSVSCCNNEIFILKGDRDIIRLSDSPEGLTSDCEHTASPCWPPPALLSSCTQTNLDAPPSLSLQCLSSLCAWPRPLSSRQWAQWKQPSQSEPWPSLWKVGLMRIGEELGRGAVRMAWEKRRRKR